MEKRGWGGLGALFLCALVASGVGCGGDDEDEGDVGDDGSGVDQATTLDQLSPDEQTDFCTWATELVSDESLIELTCTVTAIVLHDNDPSVDCDTYVSECLDSVSEPTERFECAVDPEVEIPVCASEITIGQLEACVDGIADQLVTLLDALSCDTSLEDIPPDLSSLELPAACSAIETACPDLLHTGAAH